MRCKRGGGGSTKEAITNLNADGSRHPNKDSKDFFTQDCHGWSLATDDSCLVLEDATHSRYCFASDVYLIQRANPDKLSQSVSQSVDEKLEELSQTERRKDNLTKFVICDCTQRRRGEPEFVNPLHLAKGVCQKKEGLC